ERGANGAGDHRNGARGQDLIMHVPAGTVVHNAKGDMLADLTIQELASSPPNGAMVVWATQLWLPHSVRLQALRYRVNQVSSMTWFSSLSRWLMWDWLDSHRRVSLR